VKYDGFRAMAHLDPSGVRLVSRKGNGFSSFGDLCASLEFFLKAKSAVLDGEIVCLNENGHSQFNELLFRRGTPQFCAFDLLWLNGRDLRELPLIERKRSLRRLIPPGCDSVLYVDHIEAEAERLFEFVCERDLEGMVAKHWLSRYAVADRNPAWVKIRNRRYSQMIGRDELFAKRYEAAGAPEIGWGVCDRASAAAAARLGH
jgi:bifunctional non-homologous end joining protein LigD